MITAEMAPRLFGDEVLDRNGERVGKVGQVYLDATSGQPAWATVRTGLFGLKESFVPLARARVVGETLHLPITKEQVGGAPRVDADARQMSPHDERELYRYYGLPYAGGQQGEQYASDERGKQGEPAMVRSEERLRVGTEPVETGQVRLRKYVVTEQQQVTVPVRHEEVRLEREPIADAGPGQAELVEAEHTETVYAERPVAQTEVHPVEQVRLAKRTVTEDHTVSAEVRKERIEVDDESGLLDGR